jgi:hypothetical protein
MAWLSSLTAESKPDMPVGVSNVTIHDLEALHQFTQEKQIKLEFVQNPCSPYQPDREVRDFCATHAITYMAFGLFGSQSLGVCYEGYAAPARHLQVLDDPRMHELAKQAALKPSDLLLAWANHRGITVVIYSGNHAQQNLDALQHKVSEDILRAIDALAGFEAGVTASPHEGDAGAGPLYAAYKDATAWFVLDLLMGSPAAAKLLTGLVAHVVKAHDSKTAEGKLEHVSLRLIRLVTHLQAYINLTKQQLNWTTELVRLFEDAAAALGDAPTLEHFYEWTQTDYLQYGGAPHAAEEVMTAASKHKAKLAPPTAKPAAKPETLTARKFLVQVYAIVGDGADVEIPVPPLPVLVAGVCFKSYTGTGLRITRAWEDASLKSTEQDPDEAALDKLMVEYVVE